MFEIVRGVLKEGNTEPMFNRDGVTTQDIQYSLFILKSGWLVLGYTVSTIWKL